MQKIISGSLKNSVSLRDLGYALNRGNPVQTDRFEPTPQGVVTRCLLCHLGNRQGLMQRR